MLVRHSFILNEILISLPANHKPPSIHADQGSNVENHQDAQPEQDLAIPEITVKSAMGSHGDYGTIIIHSENHPDNQENQIDSPQETQPVIKSQYETSSDATNKIYADYDMMHSVSSTFTSTDSSLPPQNDDESLQSTNLTSYRGVLTKKPVSSLLLESPIPSCIGSIDFQENHSFLTDDETITPPANLVYYKRREDFYPQKIMKEQQQQQEGDLSPPALNHNRRQSIHIVLGKAVTRIYPKPASILEGSGMPVFKPSGTYKKPKDIYRRIKTMIKHRK